MRHVFLHPAVPLLPSLPSPHEIARNAVAGLIVGIIALPLSIALAVAVGAPPIAGLYTAAFAGAAASIFGGSRFNITGPTAALVPLLHEVVLQHGARALPLVGAMAGLFLLAMSFLRLGRVMRYVPGTVVVGFTAGIALSIAFGQINTLLALQGTDPSLRHFPERLWDTLTHLPTANIPTVALSIGAIVVLFLWQRLRFRVPGALIVVVGATALVAWLGMDTPTLASTYGGLPSGFPMPTLDFITPGLIFELIPAALSIAVLAGVESILSAMVADGMAPNHPRHNPDRELFGQGIANLVSPIMGGIPATAAIARTGAAIRNGATSRLAGVFHSLTVLAVTLVLGPLAGGIPLAALAAVLVVVAWNIADVPEVKRLLKSAPREDVIVLMSTMLITLVFDLTYAVGIGVLASMFLLIRHMMKVPAASELLPNARGQIQQVSHELSEAMRARPDLAFFNAQGVISFHCAAAFEYQLLRDERPLVLRMKDVSHIDTTGLITLEGIIEHRRKRGARTVLTAVQPRVKRALARFGIVALLGPGNIFDNTIDAINAIEPPPSAAAKEEAQPQVGPSVAKLSESSTPAG